MCAVCANTLSQKSYNHNSNLNYSLLFQCSLALPTQLLSLSLNFTNPISTKQVGTWNDVVSRAVRGWLQPTVLFFEGEESARVVASRELAKVWGGLVDAPRMHALSSPLSSFVSACDAWLYG